MASSSSSKKHHKPCCVSKCETVCWRQFRKDIFAALLYSTGDEFGAVKAPGGIAEDVTSVIRLYHADFRRIPIPMLTAFLKRIAKKKNSYEWMSFIHKSGIEEPIPKCLPLYKKDAGAMVKVDEGGMPRQCMFTLSCNFRVSCALGNRGKIFHVELKKTYDMAHTSDHIARSTLDTYEAKPMYTLTYKREGCLTKLVNSRDFLFHLRDLILTGFKQVKKKRFCQQPGIKGRWGAKRKQYVACCGATVPDGCDTCRGCWQKNFEDFLLEI